MRLLRLLSFLALAATPAAAADQAEVRRLWDALQMDEVIDVMHEEGLDYGGDLDRDLLGGSGGSGFTAAVEAIYDRARMREQALADFGAELGDADLAPMLGFFEAELGARIIGLEISARRALLDPEVEAASRARVVAMDLDAEPRMDQLERFIAVNDLVETNVMGALNASYAFYVGLSEGGPDDEAVGEQDILSDVWSQEAAIRTETEDWVYGFLGLAYQPLTDAELDAYIAFSDTPAGQEMNRAIFAAFDDMFVDISRGLGGTVGRYLQGQEL
jgi:hypothetical protein